MALSKITQPEVFGPGYWAVIHSDAKRAQTYEQRLRFIEEMRPRLASLPCRICRDHALAYLDSHPMENFLHIEDGMFLWTFYFHNDVNLRLGKREFPLEEVDQYWSNIVACDNCAVSEPAIKVKIVPYQP
jgi:hypothetical protein